MIESHFLQSSLSTVYRDGQGNTPSKIEVWGYDREPFSSVVTEYRWAG